MYIQKIELENIKSFHKFTWQLKENEDPSGWHVLLGDNGSGKSSLIRTAALVLLGPDEAMKTRIDFSDWVKRGQEGGSTNIELIRSSQYDEMDVAAKDSKEGLKVKMTVSKEGTVGHFNPVSPERHIWGKKKGWFSASYGPFRRFSGGNPDSQKLFQSAPLLGRHLSVFGEDVALTEALTWLKELRFKELENGNSPESQLLAKVVKFINQDGFLPNQTRLTGVSSDGVVFVDGGENEVGIEDLSDGFRSILSMTLELIRQMVQCYETPAIFSEDGLIITLPGVVFIDEIDVHLHPSWQRKIGLWLTRHFPKIQFIVSTHSVLICQSAENGSIWKLPSPGTGDVGGRIEGIPRQRLLFGNILEALNSGAFGDDINRSEKAHEYLEELAELNYLMSEGCLSRSQEERREELQEIFGMTPNISRQG